MNRRRELYKKIIESESMPFSGDLIDTMSPLISIDEYDPKTGHEFKIIVVGFHFIEESPAEDFRSFVERGNADFVDIEVSPNPTPEGLWVVFVEIKRDESFWDTFDFILKESKRLTGQDLEWETTTYFHDTPMPIEDAKSHIKLFPSEYAISKMKRKSTNENTEMVLTDIDYNQLNEFFNLSMFESYHVASDIITFKYGNDKINMKVDAFGHEDALLEQATTEGVDLTYLPLEVRKLEQILGNSYVVECYKNKVFIQNKDRDDLLILDRYI